MLLAQAGAESARRTAGKLRRRPPKRGLTLQPGPDTPLWNELVQQMAPLLRRRGSKVHLARILGIPKQRLHVCLKARTGALDAERTLLLLAWPPASRAENWSEPGPETVCSLLNYRGRPVAL